MFERCHLDGLLKQLVLLVPQLLSPQLLSQQLHLSSSVTSLDLRHLPSLSPHLSSKRCPQCRRTTCEIHMADPQSIAPSAVTITSLASSSFATNSHLSLCSM